MRLLLEGRSLVKTYGRRERIQALRGADISLHGGEVVALVGPNGAGKTTLLRILAGILTPDSGDVFIKGVALRSVGPVARRRLQRELGFVPEVPVVLNHLTGREYLSLVAALFDVPEPEVTERVGRALERWELGGKADFFVRTYSQGMLKKLALAAALLHQPSVVLLDEPINFLDIRGQDQMWQTITELKEGGVCVLLSTHILETVEDLADRVVILREGSVAGEFGPEELQGGGWAQLRAALTGVGS